MSLSEPLVILNGLLQRAGDTTVECNRLSLGQSETINVTGDFTMTSSVHFLVKATPGFGFVTVENIFGAENGELLFLFGDRIRFRNNGNIRLPRNNFRMRTGDSLLLYWANFEWIVVSQVR